MINVELIKTGDNAAAEMFYPLLAKIWEEYAFVHGKIAPIYFSVNYRLSFNLVSKFITRGISIV